jgi:hypothetical protein
LTIQVENRGVILIGTTATGVWESVPGATAYDVWVDNLTTGQNPAVRNSQAGGNSWTSPTPLVAGHVYRWWLGSTISAPWVTQTTTTWSAPLDFNVAASAISVTVPTPTTPSGTLTAERPAFAWASAVTAAVGYDIWVDRVSSTGATLQAQVLRFSTSTGSATSAAFPATAANLTPGQFYRWWVRAHLGGSSYSAWSDAKNFNIPALAAPTLTAPANAAVVTTDRPAFAWTPVSGAAAYDLWIDKLSSTGATLQAQFRRITVAGGATGSYTLTAAQALSPGFTYRWWIGAVSSNGQAATWSSARTFSIPTLAAPTPTFGTLSSKSIAGPTVSATPTLTWNTTQASLTKWYDIWVDDVTTNTTQLIRVYVDGTQTSWKVGTPTSSTLPPAAAATRSVTSLISGHRYRWWVRAVSTDGTAGAWSGAFYFTVS